MIASEVLAGWLAWPPNVNSCCSLVSVAPQPINQPPIKLTLFRQLGVIKTIKPGSKCWHLPGRPWLASNHRWGPSIRFKWTLAIMAPGSTEHKSEDHAKSAQGSELKTMWLWTWDVCGKLKHHTLLGSAINPSLFHSRSLGKVEGK